MFPSPISKSNVADLFIISIPLAAVGAGNIHRSESQGGSPLRSSVVDQDGGSPNPGREPPVHVDHIAHTGRGGAGNVRSPSREPRDFGEFRSLSSSVRTPMVMFRSGVGLVRFYMLFCSDFLFSV